MGLTVLSTVPGEALASQLFAGAKYIGSRVMMFGRGKVALGGEKLERPLGSFEIDRPLPRTKHGDPLPDVDRPHSQLGKRGKGEYVYKQAREWGYDANGNLVPKRDIDFTDHGLPKEHPNPHQHEIYRDPKGGGYKRSEPKPLPEVELTYNYKNKYN